MQAIDWGICGSLTFFASFLRFVFGDHHSYYLTSWVTRIPSLAICLMELTGRLITVSSLFWNNTPFRTEEYSKKGRHPTSNLSLGMSGMDYVYIKSRRTPNKTSQDIYPVEPHTTGKWKTSLVHLRNWWNGSPVFKQPILLPRKIKRLSSSLSLYSWLFFSPLSNGTNPYLELNIFLLISRWTFRIPTSPAQTTLTTSLNLYVSSKEPKKLQSKVTKWCLPG